MIEQEIMSFVTVLVVAVGVASVISMLYALGIRLWARGAVEAFYWTPSTDGVQRLFVCRKWSMTKDGPVCTLNATFEQVVR